MRKKIKRLSPLFCCLDNKDVMIIDDGKYQ